MNSAARDATIVYEIQMFIQMMMRYVYISLNETERLVFESQEPETLLKAYARCIEICETAKNLIGLPLHQQCFAKSGLSSQSIQETVSSLFSLFTILFQDVPSLRTCTDIPPHIRGRTLQNIASLRQAPSSSIVGQRFQLAIHHLEVRQRCTAPGCIRTRADGRLRRCTQCKRVPYCSRGCQKAAWAHAIVHRNVCNSIAVLCNAYGTPERDVYNYTHTSEPGNNAGYEEMDLQVLNHFTRLTKLNIATPGSTSTYPPNAHHR
jgi:ferredoxin